MADVIYGWIVFLIPEKLLTLFFVFNACAYFYRRWKRYPLKDEVLLLMMGFINLFGAYFYIKIDLEVNPRTVDNQALSRLLFLFYQLAFAYANINAIRMGKDAAWKKLSTFLRLEGRRSSQRTYSSTLYGQPLAKRPKAERTP